jgi:spatacsin
MNSSGPFQVPNLKLAVLDFLKRHCPEDRELFRLVCLHFSLFSEVADLWESEGHSRVCKLLAVMAQQGAAPVLLTNSEDTKQCLHMAMLSFTHAAEYFLQVSTSHFYIGSSLHDFSLSELLPCCI